jgi:hypothetical protein
VNGLSVPRPLFLSINDVGFKLIIIRPGPGRRLGQVVTNISKMRRMSGFINLIV